MRGSSLKRVERLGRKQGLWRVLLVVGTISAIFVPLLVIDLGLILQWLVSRGGWQTPHDSILGWLFGGPGPASHLLGENKTNLLLLVVIGWCLAMLEAGSLLWLPWLVQRYALQISSALRRAIHEQAFRLGPHDLLSPSRSRPEELFADKVAVVHRGLVEQRLCIPRAVVQCGLLLLLALAVHVWLTLLAILLAYYVLLFSSYLRRRGELLAEELRGQAKQGTEELLVSLRLTPLAMGYSLSGPPGVPFAERLREVEDLEFRAHTHESLRTPLVFLIVLLVVFLVLLIVGVSEEVTVPTSVLLGMALVAAYFPAAQRYRLPGRLAESHAAAADILAYLDRLPGVTQIPDASALNRLERDITLDRVTLADRHGRRLLDSVSLVIPAGQVAAILSSDTQTPLALAGLFVRFYDPAAGRILYDNHDVCRATLDTVRGQAILVTADGPVFPGTIAENIACGNSGFTPLQIQDAVRQAQVEELVRSLPEGVSTVIGIRESRLDDDQAFRIGLARALLRQPSLLVVEEPAGPLDDVASRQLDAALREAAPGRTLIVLPARLSTLRSADCVYVFHEGKVESQGKHADLLQSSELYRHLNYLRFNIFRNAVKN